MEVYGKDREIILVGSKKLDKNVATSIMCSDADILSKSVDLQVVNTNKDNMYYRIIGSDFVIMHVQCGFCVVVDYKVKGINIPCALSQNHYGVYQVDGRDWIRNTSKKCTIGDDIQRIVDANYARKCRENKMTIDHEAETFNELFRNCKFKGTNVNDGSHRRTIWIDTDEKLQGFINRMRNYEYGYICTY